LARGSSILTRDAVIRTRDFPESTSIKFVSGIIADRLEYPILQSQLGAKASFRSVYSTPDRVVWRHGIRGKEEKLVALTMTTRKESAADGASLNMNKVATDCIRDKIIYSVTCS
jgi:hypothetical protein